MTHHPFGHSHCSARCESTCPAPLARMGQVPTLLATGTFNGRTYGPSAAPVSLGKPSHLPILADAAAVDTAPMTLHWVLNPYGPEDVRTLCGAVLPLHARTVEGAARCTDCIDLLAAGARAYA